MSPDEIHIDLVETNLHLCHQVLEKANFANKGNLSHRIN